MATAQPTGEPRNFPEDESMDPVGEPYPEQEPLTPEPGDDPPHPPFSPDNEPDIPQDPEAERVVSPEPLDP
ncbi:MULTISPECIES: hypothetical protein [unclassified Comamonas]|uniref:hypothetical protein n=1 Tax=unclassified Comamonas TaxID=2638500 RepID=UPI001EFA8B44|nr:MULTISPECIES: hypothetical protein [unclassified Comamonas]ULR91301.1 hypothetical protein MJ205_10890 [Comamonas sp. B21-038]